MISLKSFSLIVLIFITSFSWSQNDTIYSIDCGGNIPVGWEVFDSTGNDFFWVHATSGLEAVFNPASFTDMNSSTNSNGWLMFHAAFYNSDTSGGVYNEVDPILYMNSTLSSTPFDFTGESTVYLSFEQWYHTLSSSPWGSMC